MKILNVFCKSQIFVLSTLIILFNTACSGEEAISTYQYQVPEQIGDGWQTIPLEDVGMDTEKMVSFMNDLSVYPDHWVHSVLVIKDGKLVFEEYFQGKDLDLSNLDGKLDFKYKDFDRDIHIVCLRFPRALARSYSESPSTRIW